MIVLCEGCQRRFQLDDARIPKTGARVRCKHCHHRFRVPPPEDAPAEAREPSAPGSPPPAADDRLFGGADPAETADPGETSDGFGELRFVNEPLGEAAEAVEAAPAPASEPELPAPAAEPDLEPEAPSQPDFEPQPLLAADASLSGAGLSGGSDAPWEFGDSSLSFDDASSPLVGETSVQQATAAEPQAPADAGEPGGPAAEPVGEPPAGETAAEGPVVDETPSLQAVAPDAGADSVLFEMPAGADSGAPLQLENELESATPAEPEPVAVEAASPEIGSAEDWDAIAEEDSAERAPEPVPAAAPRLRLAPVEATAADPDWPLASDDLPEAVGPPPPPARGRSWLEHASWALSLMLLVAVGQGSVRIDPVPVDVPPGQVEVAGLSAENVRARFVENARSGTLFVVSGELRNRSERSVQPRRLVVVLLDAEGRLVEGNAAPVATALPEAMVRETPIGALAQQQGVLAEGLAERSLTPGEGVAFLAILSEVPDEAVRFRIEADTNASRTPQPEAG